MLHSCVPITALPASGDVIKMTDIAWLQDMHASQTAGVGDQHAEEPSSNSSASLSDHQPHASGKGEQVDPAVALPAANDGQAGSIEDTDATLAADSWQGGWAKLAAEIEVEAGSHAFAAMDQHISALELALHPALPDMPSPMGLQLFICRLFCNIAVGGQNIGGSDAS